MAICYANVLVNPFPLKPLLLPWKPL